MMSVSCSLEKVARCSGAWRYETSNVISLSELLSFVFCVRTVPLDRCDARAEPLPLNSDVDISNEVFFCSNVTRRSLSFLFVL